MEYYAAVQKKEAALNHESLWAKSHHALSKRSSKMQKSMQRKLRILSNICTCTDYGREDMQEIGQWLPLGRGASRLGTRGRATCFSLCHLFYLLNHVNVLSIQK